MTLPTFSSAEIRALEGCTYCPRLCHFACPTAQGDASESSTGWGLMTLVNAARRGLVPVDADLVDVLHRCTSCGRCTAFCVHETPVAEIVTAARRRLVAGMGGPASVREAAEALPIAAPRSGAAGVALWLGCDEPLAPGVAARLGLVVAALLGEPVDLVRATDERVGVCGGGVARRGGLDALAGRQSDALRAAFAGYRRVIGTCREACAGGDVESLVAVLAAHADRLGALTRGGPTSIVLHGACRARRPVDAGADEHAILDALGVGCTAAFAIRGEQECCGGDLLYAAVHPEGARRAAEAVVQGAREVGDDRPLVSSTARCAGHMARACGAPVPSFLELVVERCSIPA